MYISYSSLLLILVISCAQPEKNEAELVRAVANGIIEADNRADLEQVLSYYHPQAILLPPGKPEISGLENIRRNYEGIFAVSVLQLSLKEEELVVADTVAYCRGRTQGKVLLKSDSTVRRIDDQFLMVLEKVGGHWKIKRLIWN